MNIFMRAVLLVLWGGVCILLNMFIPSCYIAWLWSFHLFTVSNYRLFLLTWIRKSHSWSLFDLPLLLLFWLRLIHRSVVVIVLVNEYLVRLILELERHHLLQVLVHWEGCGDLLWIHIVGGDEGVICLGCLWSCFVDRMNDAFLRVLSLYLNNILRIQPLILRKIILLIEKIFKRLLFLRVPSIKLL